MAEDNQEQNLSTESECPVSGRRHTGPTNVDWWPNQPNLKILHQTPPNRSDGPRTSIMLKNSRAST